MPASVDASLSASNADAGNLRFTSPSLPYSASFVFSRIVSRKLLSADGDISDRFVTENTV